MLLCPSCSPVLEARALVLSESFWTNATYAMLPFVVAGLVVHQLVKRMDRGGDARR